MKRLVHALNGTLINRSDCTIDTCSIVYAQVSYVPSLGGNAAYLLLFAVILIAQIGVSTAYRTWGFLVGLFGGLVLEILGYLGRILLHKNQFDFNAFLLYLICLTIGPAFLSASIYLCLARIITVYGTDISRLKPQTYTKMFVSCDFVSLVLQAVGGALASTAKTIPDSDRGVHIMIVGLGFQVISLILFMGLWAEFVWRVSKTPDYARDSRFVAIRTGFRFKAFQFCE
jgi:hypothetical protein